MHLTVLVGTIQAPCEVVKETEPDQAFNSKARSCHGLVRAFEALLVTGANPDGAGCSYMLTVTSRLMSSIGDESSR